MAFLIPPLASESPADSVSKMLVKGMYTFFVEAFLTIELPEVATRPPDKPGLSLFLEPESGCFFPKLED